MSGIPHQREKSVRRALTPEEQQWIYETPHRLVLQSARGTMLSQSAWRRMWESYWCELNLRYGGFPANASKYDPHGLPPRIPRFTAHWLRHTYVTLLYRAGVDVATAKEQAGHADVQTTLSIYTHLDRQFKKNSMALLDQYISDLNLT